MSPCPVPQHRLSPAHRLSFTFCLLFAMGVFTASPALAGGAIVRDHTIDAQGVETLEIRANVGELRFRRSQGETIQVRLSIEGDRQGLLRRRTDVSGMDLEIDRRGSRLALVFEPSNAKADWVVELPQIPDLRLRLGVGEMTGELPGGALEVKLGVGEVNLVLPRDAVRSAKATAGVGSAQISGGDDTIASRTLVSETSSSEGPGEHRVRVEVGVGEARLRLQ